MTADDFNPLEGAVNHPVLRHLSGIYCCFTPRSAYVILTSSRGSDRSELLLSAAPVDADCFSPLQTGLESDDAGTASPPLHRMLASTTVAHHQNGPSTQDFHMPLQQ